MGLNNYKSANTTIKFIKNSKSIYHMLEANKKAFRIKFKALDRTLKDYKAYKAELESYDIN